MSDNEDQPTREDLEGMVRHLRNVVGSLQQQVAAKAIEVAEREAIIQSMRQAQQVEIPDEVAHLVEEDEEVPA